MKAKHLKVLVIQRCINCKQCSQYKLLVSVQEQKEKEKTNPRYGVERTVYKTAFFGVFELIIYSFKSSSILSFKKILYVCIMYTCVHSREGQRTTSVCLSLSTLFETGVFVVYHSVPEQLALKCLEILLSLPLLSP